MSFIDPAGVKRRVRAAMKKQRLTYEKLAKMLDLRIFDVSDPVHKGRYNSIYFPLIAKALDEDLEYLIFGTRNTTPIIEWSQVSAWETSNNHLPIISKNPKTRALRLLDDSMKTIFVDTPTFPAGTYVIAEPVKTAEIGSFVIAILEDGETTFRQLTLDKKRGCHILKALNPYFKDYDVTEGVIIKAVVTASYNEL